MPRLTNMELVVSIVGVGSMTFPNTTIQSLNLRKTAQEPIRVKMVDLLPSLTDTEENCLMSLICCICQQKEEREDDTLLDIRDNTAIKLPPISTLPMPFPEH